MGGRNVNDIEMMYSSNKTRLLTGRSADQKENNKEKGNCFDGHK